jgi:Holliday junction resolvase-like predicted endonuclease
MGKLSEFFALQDYLRRGFDFQHHRLRTPFGEADLILRDPDKTVTIVEVKTVTSFLYWETRVTSAQERRLERICAWFYEMQSHNCRYGKMRYPRLIYAFANPFSGGLHEFEGEG